jgi:hypothetical protein
MVWMVLAGIILLIGIIFLVDWWKIGGIREHDRRTSGAYLTTRKVV